MSDALWAARMGDALSHTPMMADILGGVLEVAANIAITAVATAAVVAATGITVATGGLGACLLGAVVGVVVGLAMSKTGADKGLSNMCEGIANALFPPMVMATILSGSTDTLINSTPAARAAGAVPSHVSPSGTESEQPPAAQENPEDPSYLDMAKGFFSQMWRPTVATPAPGAVPKPLDLVTCMKHPPMPPQLLAEGSEKVTVNSQPAVRSGDRSTCDATVVSSGLISPDVTIGGGSVVVREIRSGKTPGVGLAVTALMMLKGSKGKFLSNLPCMLLGGVSSYAVSQAVNAVANAAIGSPNPVHAATGAKVLGAEDELDFVLPGTLPIEWQRVYNSRDERRDGLFGAGWSVAYEISVQVLEHPDGGDRLLYIDEQGRRIDMGSIALGSAVFSTDEGLAVRRNSNGQLLIESADGVYRLFEPTPQAPARLRLAQLGDRNDNRIYLDYDNSGRLKHLRDTLDQVRIELSYHLGRLSQVERLYSDQRREVLVNYSYTTSTDLAEVRDASGQVQRRFAYDTGRRMIEHQLPAGLRCFYQWACIDDLEWRVVQHWTEDGDLYRFDYDLKSGTTRITDGLGRVSTRKWNRQFQIIQFTDALDQTWLFDWNEERQFIGATDPQGGRYELSYDDTGNLTGSLDPLGRNESTTWLEHWALPVSGTDSEGNSWQLRYDQRGNCIAETDPQGHVTQYRYDNCGQLVEIIDAAGKSKKLRWNPFGQLIEHIDCSGYPTRFNYDERGYLQAITDALGERTTFVCDVRGLVLSTELPDGRVEHFQRDGSGQLIAHTDFAGHSTYYQRNRQGQVCQRLDAHGRQVNFAYDSYGRLQTLTNENGERYRIAWDANDRVAEQQDLDGSVRRYHYDALNNITRMEAIPAPHGSGMALVSITPEAPIVHCFERDASGRLVAKVTDDGRTEYTYDSLDQLKAITFTDNAGEHQTINFGYDTVGQLIEERSAAGVLQHHYDELGNLSQTHLPDGRWLNRLHYGSGHLHQINLDGQVISDFERDRLHREVLRTQGHLSTRHYYDRCGRLRARERGQITRGSVLPAAVQKQFEYDPADNLIGKLEQQSSGQRRQLLHYDATDRVVASQDNLVGQRETYSYDAAANLLDGPRPGAGLVQHNKLLTFQDKRYRYDGFGRMIEKRSANRGVQRFTYDAEHRLIEVHNEHGGQRSVVRMTYDPLGRRTAKATHDGNGYLLSETRFTWDGLRLLQEHKHAQTSLYIYKDEGHEPLARVDGSGAQQKVRYYHNDLNGLPELLSEAEGQTVWHASYQIWGNTVQETREPYYIEEQNLRFQGQYLDRETGLHHNIFRFYDPDIGRFTTPDPIGLAGGLNLYLYSTNPQTWIDPYGLSPEDLMRYKPKASITPEAGDRATAINRAWGQERELVARGGGSRNWTAPEREMIKNTTNNAQLNSKMSKAGYTGHHINSVKGNGALGPAWKGDPRNIVFLQNAKHPSGVDEHMNSPQGHRKSYTRASKGRLIDRVNTPGKPGCGK